MVESIPPCNIRIDKDGVWYYHGVEIIRQDILEMFYSNLERDKEGRYLLRMGKEVCVLDVEDTPWIIKDVELIPGKGECPSKFQIRLSDNSRETLNLNRLWISDENVLYCMVKDNRFPARFSRPAYYEFSNYIQYDEINREYFVALNGEIYKIEFKS